MNGIELTAGEWQGLLQKKQIIFSYVNYKDVKSERIVRPEDLRILFDHVYYPDNLGELFLIAYDFDKEDHRHFLLSKIEIDLKLNGFGI